MTEEVRFPSSVGPDLAGVLEAPEGGSRGWGLLVHGFTLGKDSPAAFRIARGLVEHGIGMLRFDCLGLGDSDGDDNASEIFRAAVHPRSFIALEGSDHFLTKDGQAERAARIISAWADPYL